MNTIKLKDFKAKEAHNIGLGRLITVAVIVDGNRIEVIDREQHTKDTIPDILSEYDPEMMYVTFWAKNGEDRGVPRVKAAGSYQVIDISSNTPSMNGFQDAEVVEEESTPKTAIMGGSNANTPASIHEFMYQTTLTQLNDAKAELRRVKDKLERSEKENIEKDRQILTHEHNFSDLEKEVQRSKTTKAQLAGFGEIAASSPGITEMISNIAKSLVPSQPSMTGLSMSNYSRAIVEFMSSQPEPVQKTVYEVLNGAIQAFKKGNKDIFNSIINHVLANTKAGTSGDGEFFEP